MGRIELVSQIRPLLNGGRLDEAAMLCQAALLADAGDATAINLLGVIRRMRGNLPAAEALFRSAVDIAPRFYDAWVNLGCVLRDQGRPADAIDPLRRAMIIEPSRVEAALHIGVCFERLGQWIDAVHAYRHAISLRPESFEAHFNLGNALCAANQPAAAIGSYQQAIRLQPGFTPAAINLGNALRSNGQRDAAMQCFGAVLESEPTQAEANHNQAVCLREMGRVEEAIAHWRNAVAARADYADARFGLGMALLATGRYAEGWREYEWRRERMPSHLRRSSLPQWDGSPLAGRRVLVHAEQGLGDAIQFVRFFPRVETSGGSVTLECDPRLVQLFTQSPALAGVHVVAREESSAAPAADLQLPLMSFPFALGLDREADWRMHAPYLAADPQERLAARKVIAELVGPHRDHLLKVGLVWAGSPDNGNDARRSLPLSAISPLLSLAASFFSLQTGPAAAQSKTAGFEIIHDLSHRLTDLAATAAFLAEMDLVISVDTAVAHLAGATGRPVWLLTPFAADFRWLTEGTRTAWYPSMRLFRQDREGDWQVPLAAIGAELASLLKSGRPTLGNQAVARGVSTGAEASGGGALVEAGGAASDAAEP